MPEKNLPFFEMFALYTPDAALAAQVKAWLVTGAVMDRKARTIEVQLLCPAMPDPALLARLSGEVAQAYGLAGVVFQPACPQPAEDAFIPPPDDSDVPPPPADEDVPPEPETLAEAAPVAQAPSPKPEPSPALSEQQRLFQQTEALRQKAMKEAMQAHAKERGFSSKRIYGTHKIRKVPVPMNTLELDMGIVTVEGDVFAVEHRELKKRNAWVISFDVTDCTSSIRVSKFMPGDEGMPIVNGVKPGMHLKIAGRLNLNRFDNDMVLDPLTIETAEKQIKQDNAPEKRVELHLHTRMSAMDALPDTKDAVKRAIAWGHPAIAITDHGVAQSFPDAWSAGKGKCKVLLGTEAYYINDVDERLTVRGSLDQDLDEAIVCFDLETTGLDKETEVITEIGAVVLEHGEVKERFQTFVDPKRPLAPNIIQLTGITDEMLVGAPSQEEAIRAFLDFVDGRPLAAHNAEFDIGFIRKGCQTYGIPFEPTYLDTLPLAQNLLPELTKFKLDIVCQHLHLPDFNHHRASDDAAMVGYMLVPFTQMLRDRGVQTLQQVNAGLAKTSSLGKAKRMPKHLIVLAKNKVGLRNLYKLISLANLNHFHRNFPIMPKSEINENREGLILGSACEAGELYQAIIRGKDWGELKRIASWYDYLEIQPLANNRFMLDKGIAKDMEDLRNFNRTVVRLGQELGKLVVATGDVHFLNPEDETFRHILLATKGFEDADKPNPLYFRTTDEMLEEFSYLGKEKAYEVVVTNPNLIADMCESLRPVPHNLFAPKIENSVEDLKRLVYGKFRRLYGENPPELMTKRVETELHDIINCHYDVIYMSAQKLVQNSLEHGYLVGSRGSVGSSIVAYMSGITEVNSFPPHYRCPNPECKYTTFDVPKGYGCGADLPDAVCPKCGTKFEKDGFNIPFETFLGFGGDKVPDIDLNFSGEYQSKAHAYCIEMFGKSHVFRAGTIGTVAEKTAFGYVKKYLSERGKTASRAEEARLAAGCVGVRRTTGQHPGGLVVIPQENEIWDFCPVQHPADDPQADQITTHFEYHSMEENLLKLDMLGHDDPTMIRMMEDMTGIDAKTIPLDDKDTMSIFISSKVLGYEDDKILGPTGAVAIPEFNTRFTRGMLMDTMPTRFDTLLRLSGFSHGTDVWLGNAKDLITSKTATVDQAIGCRDDIMLYLISCGMPEKRSFKIMEAVRKGRGLPEGAEDEMKAAGVPEWYIGSCKKIKYLFPKAHAVAYVMMAFRIAWFKVHHPLAFYSAYFYRRSQKGGFDAVLMTHGKDAVVANIDAIENNENATDKDEDLLTTLEVAYEYYIRGFEFLPISIYDSHATKFIIKDGKLLPPFVAISGLGENAAWDLMRGREGKTFLSVEEVAAACPKVSKTHIQMLREAGAFGDLPDTSQVSFF